MDLEQCKDRVINAPACNWNVSSSKFEVCYQDKEQKDISGKLYFVNVVREHTLKTIIADAIRAKLFQ